MEDTHIPPVINGNPVRKLLITGDPRTLRTEADLTPETFATLCALLNNALESDNYRVLRPWRAAALAIAAAGAMAVRQGWSDVESLWLETVAGQLYARLIAEGVRSVYGA